MQRISVNLTNDCDGIELNYSIDLPAIGNKNYALQKPFEFFDSNWQRKTPTVIHHLLSRPRHSILHSNIFFYVQLFATIILS